MTLSPICAITPPRIDGSTRVSTTTVFPRRRPSRDAIDRLLPLVDRDGRGDLGHGDAPMLVEQPPEDLARSPAPAPAGPDAPGSPGTLPTSGETPGSSSASTARFLLGRHDRAGQKQPGGVIVVHRGRLLESVEPGVQLVAVSSDGEGRFREAERSDVRPRHALPPPPRPGRPGVGCSSRNSSTSWRWA